jgi:hypothetical protein
MSPFYKHPEPDSPQVEAQWDCRQTADGEPLPNEEVISKTQAIHLAFADLGRDADACRVQHYLRDIGLEVELPLIQQVQAKLPSPKAGKWS